MVNPVWLVVILCAFLVIILCWNRGRLWYLASKIPGANGFPLIGSAFSLPKENEQFVNFLRNFQTEKSPTMKLWAGPWLWVCVSDPEDIEIVLKSTKCLDRTFLKVMLDCARAGDGIVSLSGKKWDLHRKVIIPTFKLGTMKKCISILQTKSFELVDSLSSNSHGIEINIYKTLSSYNLQSVCSALMGVNVNQNDDKLIHFLNSVCDSKRFLVDAAKNPWLLVEAKFPFTKLAKKVKKCSTNLLDLSNFLVSQKINMVKNERLERKTELEKVNFAFLDHLVESLFSETPVLTEEEIRGETISMLVEGYENISSGNSFALLLLAFHPDIQKRAFKELFDIFGSDKRRPATFQDLQEMTFLEQIIKETLRLYPSLPFIPRGVEEELKIGNYILPVGSTILINLLSAQRNPKYFPSPNKFDPDNFSPENKLAQHPFAYIPFSYGPRMCVGLKYAMFQMKVMLSTILRHYQLLPVGKLEHLERLEFVLSLAPVLGVNLKLIPRSYDV